MVADDEERDRDGDRGCDHRGYRSPNRSVGKPRNHDEDEAGDVQQLAHTKDPYEHGKPTNARSPHRLANAADGEPLRETRHPPDEIYANEKHGQQR